MNKLVPYEYLTGTSDISNFDNQIVAFAALAFDLIEPTKSQLMRILKKEVLNL